jgi:hypothetical protein
MAEFADSVPLCTQMSKAVGRIFRIEIARGPGFPGQSSPPHQYRAESHAKHETTFTGSVYGSFRLSIFRNKYALEMSIFRA